MEVRNRMLDRPPATMEMDLLGLRQARPDETVLTLTDHHSHKETHTMRHDTVLRLKDDLTMPDQSQNADEVARLARQRAREIDAALRTLGLNASIALLVNQLMTEGLATKSKAQNPYLEHWLNADARFKNEEQARRVGRELASTMAVPPAKRVKPGFARIY